MAVRRSKKVSEKRIEFLGGYLPYLLHRVAKEMLRGVDQKFQDRGLTVSKWRILAVLADRGTCRFGEIAQLASIEPASLSRFVNALVHDGLIRRKRSTSDGRGVTITLTEKGEVTFDETLPWAADTENKLVRGLDPRDVARMKAMLKMMFFNIHHEILEGEGNDGLIAVNAGLLDL